jgi:tetratricopeptide (TPR) repeat protein
MIYTDDNEDDRGREYYNKEQIVAREVGDDLGYARATNNLALIEKKAHNYPAAIRLATEALGVFKQQNNLLGMTSADNTLANAYEAQRQYPEAVSYAKQNLDASIELRELRGVAAGCGTLSNIYEDTGDYAEMAFASLCAAIVLKELKIDEKPDTKIDYEVFHRRMKEYIQTKANDTGIMEDQEKRVEEILVKLNLGTDVMHAELLALKNWKQQRD